ncbi:hypothetical protein H112_00724 [Trichophyton rubrum D6]|nr:hypothetical protein H102_00713 [Trichophyton rubrum CBS 100081]EZF88906.1 hypothetical protein H110_00724 [Trichophyton rubrum MR1448]EZF99610.1 hypothetical protein H113_00722 [Trichophyton rubrum MR1459]EZG21232.1 hypothetical protein H107_00772 [Trichophyton rubrum CBS 202.88]KDB38072.1 hypothetical protein H112_00724 [Trichophyton rubrum D6]
MRYQTLGGHGQRKLLYGQMSLDGANRASATDERANEFHEGQGKFVVTIEWAVATISQNQKLSTHNPSNSPRSERILVIHALHWLLYGHMYGVFSGIIASMVNVDEQMSSNSNELVPKKFTKLAPSCAQGSPYSGLRTLGESHDGYDAEIPEKHH